MIDLDALIAEQIDEVYRCEDLDGPGGDLWQAAMRSLAEKVHAAALAEGHAKGVREGEEKERKRVLDICQAHMCTPVCRTMGGRFCHAAIAQEIEKPPVEEKPCLHKFEADPGMRDSMLRYCEKCGISEDALPKIPAGGEEGGR